MTTGLPPELHNAEARRRKGRGGIAALAVANDKQAHSPTCLRCPIGSVYVPDIALWTPTYVGVAIGRELRAMIHAEKP